jgi:hypothetical protein
MMADSDVVADYRLWIAVQVSPRMSLFGRIPRQLNVLKPLVQYFCNCTFYIHAVITVKVNGGSGNS